jgi:hypothetical protein
VLLAAIGLWIAFDKSIYYRFWISLQAIWGDFVFIGQKLVGVEGAEPLWPMKMITESGIYQYNMPIDFQGMWNNLQGWAMLLTMPSNMMDSGKDLLTFIAGILAWGGGAIGLGMLISLAVKKYYLKENDKKVNEKSKPLILFEKWVERPLGVVFLYIKNYLSFLGLWHFGEPIFFKRGKVYKILLILGLLEVTGIIPLAIDFIGFYLYFVFTYNFSALYYYISDVFVTIIPFIWNIGIWFIVIIGYLVFDWWRQRHAMKKLREYEAKDKNFISGLGVAVGTYGPPKAGKTCLNTVMTIYDEQMKREEALGILKEIYSEFPNFPFSSLEKIIDDNFKTICNKEQAKNLIYETIKKTGPKYIFCGFDLKNAEPYYDNLQLRHLKDELLDYSQAYYVYKSVLVLGGFSIRIDDVKEDGCFPLYNYDFMGADGRQMTEYSYYCKPLDQNSLRLLKKLGDGDTSLPDSGIYTMSEIAKERGNRITNIKRAGYEVNPSNDGWNETWKVIRHMGTIRNHCFIRAFWDDQRLGALGGDAAQIAETNIFIKDSNHPMQTSLLFWFIEPMISSWISSITWAFVLQFRHKRHDKTLFLHLMDKALFYSERYLTLRVNLYSYFTLDLAMSNSDINGSTQQGGGSTFYIMPKVAYSKRYKSACYEGLFIDKKLKEKIGINQMSPYRDWVASLDEIAKTNPYFGLEFIEAMGLTGIISDDKSQAQGNIEKKSK